MPSRLRPCFLLAAVGLLSPLAHSQTPAESKSRPVIVPDARVLQLDDLGLYQLSYQRRDQAEQFFPVGWTGYFDDVTGVACQPAAEQNGRRAWLLHPPWMGGPTGLARQRFTFALPAAQKIELKGAFAMRSNNTEGSDGVTFRVKVGDETLVDENRKATDWRDFSFNLTRFAGKTVTITFESDAGPQNNSSFDFALWGGRQLVFDGFNPPVVSHPTPVALPLAQLSTAHSEAVSEGAFTGQQSFERADGKLKWGYTGADGTFMYTWSPPTSDADSPLGTLQLSARMKTANGQLAPPVDLSLGLDAHIEWANNIPFKLKSSTFSNGKTKAPLALISQYEANGRTVRVIFSLRQRAGKSVVFYVQCDEPVIHSLFLGSWGPVMRRQTVPTPYYTSNSKIYFLQKENLFVNTFNDWTASSASTIQNGHAIYNPLTDGTYRPLSERVVFSPAWNLDEVFPNIPNPPSPYLKEVGGKLVLDVWSGSSFFDIAHVLPSYYAHGLRNVIILIHVWQRDGYDNGLPAHYPARASQGGDAGMAQLVKTATGLGYRIALHENYVDYYTNYEGYKESDISLRSNGEKETAWYNEGTKMQSFAIQPNAILPLAKSQSPEIHQRYGTNANYLDVHSAVPPWFHVDFRASSFKAGQYNVVFDTHKALWEFERQTHKGPTFGEGNNHWFWSGLLDGAEAQVDDGWNVPTLVNFDLLKIHPLQSNHGMGYYERWWDKPTWSGLPPMQVLDRYRVQTLAFGHTPFLGGSTWDNLPIAWLEHNLVTPVTARYATARPIEITYLSNGKWLDDSALIRAGATSSVLRIRYDNGLTLVANNSANPITVGGIGGASLPAYGWRAEGAGVIAYTALHDGIPVDFAQTATTTFANARNAQTWNLGAKARTRVSITDFAQTAPRRFRVNYRWAVGEGFEDENTAFVHFTNGNSGRSDGIAFQDDHRPATPTNKWAIDSVVNDGPREITLPADLKDGDYEMVTGLYNDKGRRQLAGDTDANGRVRLGTIRVANAGQQITFIPPKDESQQREKLYAASLNTANKVVDFGTIRTNGSVMVRRDGPDWVLQTMPPAQEAIVELDSTRFGFPKIIERNTPGTSETAPSKVDGKFWKLALTGAQEYRWKAAP
ncbi:hypothetical protein EON83_27005 [bacterium]|nr:MAG: hypothetical protein EON83_27005 [bacterium]